MILPVLNGGSNLFFSITFYLLVTSVNYHVPLNTVIYCLIFNFNGFIHHCFGCYGSLFNTRIYNLVSVPQITRFLLEDAINSSKTDTQNDSKNEKRSYGKVKNNKTISKILPFIRILYFKQQPVFCDALQVKI